MNIDAHRVGLVVFLIGVLDVALTLWTPFIWKLLASSSDISSFPLLAFSPNPLAAWLQSVFIGVIVAVRGAFIYTKTTPIMKSLLLTALSALFTLLSMIYFSSQDYTLSLVTFIIAVMLFAV
jgi:hypothetical protein